MDMKKISCAVLIAAASMSAAMASDEVMSPAPDHPMLPKQLCLFWGRWSEPPSSHSSPSTCTELSAQKRRHGKEREE
ncbi:hypothetical protein CK203_074478 [Vitis vinifera]|uniref:Uncharacterized protein n=1 Tax=Vitis vinifera TaxID=29760 RepID=A0A438EH46_VITVI|nr:hypothetical protein CK203_074478 [Vitis vinifera]